MTWLDSLERRFGSLAIPGLIRYVAMLNALVFLLYQLNPGFLTLLELYPGAVLHGEVWRLVTYLFIPQMTSLLPMPEWLNAAFFVLFLWWVGDSLETAWGAFKVNLFYLLGMIGTTIAAFGFGTAFSNVMLNTSLFFAFARYYPDVVIYMAYVLPMKVRWVAGILAAFLFYQFLIGSNSYRMAFIAALANYLIFFGPEIVRDARNRRTIATRRRRFDTDVKTAVGESLHRCHTCGATELTHPALDFRVARDGEEYCTAHLPKAPVEA